jgi:hypothetical protein
MAELICMLHGSLPSNSRAGASAMNARRITIDSHDTGANPAGAGSSSSPSRIRVRRAPSRGIRRSAAVAAWQKGRPSDRNNSIGRPATAPRPTATTRRSTPADVGRQREFRLGQVDTRQRLRTRAWPTPPAARHRRTRGPGPVSPRRTAGSGRRPGSGADPPGPRPSPAAGSAVHPCRAARPAGGASRSPRSAGPAAPRPVLAPVA